MAILLPPVLICFISTADGTPDRYVGDEVVQGEVDHPVAAQLLSEAPGTGPDADALPPDVAAAIEAPPSPDELSALADAYSPDVATLAFVHGALADPANAALHRAFQAELEAVRDGPRVADAEVAEDFVFLFAPGFAWSSFPETGADFAAQRTALAKAGYRVGFVATDEYATVADNAVSIADAIRAESGQGHRIVVISASKGGPETARALSLLGSDAADVDTWVNIGGVLRGTYLADRHQRGPRRVLASAVLGLQGIPATVLDDLGTERLGARADELTFAEHIRVVSYVGAPLASQVTRRARGNWRKLSRLGPNDGMTLLTDAVATPGLVLPDVGLDHYYDDPDVVLKTLALARLVTHDRVPPVR